MAGFWGARLQYEKSSLSWGNGKELGFMAILCLLAGLAAKVPDGVPMDKDLYYMRNIGFIVFPALVAYFAWKNGLSAGKVTFAALAMTAGAAFINLLPYNEQSDTFVLSCIHLPIFLWSLLGFVFSGGGTDAQRRLNFLGFNGDLVVMTTLMVIAGGILSGVTIGLFGLLGADIEWFYSHYVITLCLPSVPILATHLTRTNPQLVGKVSPILARIFSPLVLVMLTLYLATMAYLRKDPYNDREFLLLFNVLLVGVMAIIFFSVAEATRERKPLAELWVLLLLSIVTVVVNGIALSAIVFRISEWGFTPNRTAVLGSNLLVLANLVLVTVQLFKVVSGKAEASAVGNVIARYLPVYSLWAVVVTFLFPLIFAGK